MSKLYSIIFLVLLSFIGYTQKPELISPIGHNDLIMICQFSPNGKYLVSGANDGTVKLWEPETGKLLHTFLHSAHKLNSLTFSPDGSFLTCDFEDGFDIWSIYSGRLHYRINTLNPDTLFKENIFTSKDGRFLLTVINKKDTIITGNVSGQTCLNKYGYYSYYDSYFSKSGKELVYQEYESQKSSIRLLDVTTGKIIREYPDGKTLTGSLDNNLFAFSRNDSLIIGDLSTGNQVGAVKTGLLDKIVFLENDAVAFITSDHYLKKYLIKENQILFNEKVSDTSVLTFKTGMAGKYIGLSDNDGFILLLDIATGKLLRKFRTNGNYVPEGIVGGITYGGFMTYYPAWDISFSADGKFAAIQNFDSTIVWNLQEDKLSAVCKSHSKIISGAYFSSKNNLLLTCTKLDQQKYKLNAFDIKNNRPAYCIIGSDIEIGKQRMDKEETVLSFINMEGQASILNLKTGEINYSIKNSANKYEGISISKDGKLLLLVSKKSVATVVNIKSQKELFRIESYKTDDCYDCGQNFAFSPIKNTLAAVIDFKKILLLNSFSGAPTDSIFLDDKDKQIRGISFSKDGMKLIIYWQKSDWEAPTVSVVNIPDKKVLLSIDNKWAWIEDYNLSEDGKQLFTYSFKSNSAELWDVETGKKVTELTLSDRTYNIQFFNNSKYLATNSTDGKVYMWDNNTYKKSDSLESVNYLGINIQGDTALIGYNDGSIDLYSLRNKMPIVKFLIVDSTDWMATTPDGLFDASPDAMKLSHFAVNDSTDTFEPWKLVEFNQLKHRYYQPGLLPITLGYSEEKVREVPKLNDLPLPPEIKPDYSNNKLSLNITDKGGGIGKISIFINNAEIIEDANSGKTLTTKNSIGTLLIDLEKYSSLFNPDEKNEIKIIAFNKENWLSSRPQKISFTPASTKGIELGATNNNQNNSKPHLYALICGVSDYSGTSIDLKYASKDAQDFSHALSLAAKKLFGNDYVHITTLQSESSSTNLQPNKENFLKAFRSIDSTNKEDIFIVYLSGHGLNYGGQDGDFYYLLSQASDAQVSYLNDSQIRQQVSLSSDEIAKLFNEKRAGKKILILDACASGKAAENLSMAMRDIPASQTRAMDRMADRTGFYVLSGSAADAVSYETSIYGQGLLTYSLIKSIRGAALRRDGNEEYVDIHKMLQYAVDEVPQLAKGIGGVQQPLYRSPGDQKSFDIGQVDDTIKKQIIIAEPKPVFIASNFMNEARKRDDLKLSEAINGQMREVTAKGKQAEFIYIEAKDYPNAWELSGTYKVIGNDIIVDCLLFKNNIEKNFTIKGFANKLPDIVTYILKEVKKQIQ